MIDSRVTPEEAARELNMGVLTLRRLMQDEKLSIGYAVQHKKRWSYFIYRNLLKQEKERLGIK